MQSLHEVKFTNLTKDSLWKAKDNSTFYRAETQTLPIDVPRSSEFICMRQSESIVYNHVTTQGPKHGFVRYYADSLS